MNQNLEQAFSVIHGGLQKKLRKKQEEVGVLRQTIEQTRLLEEQCVRQIAEWETALAVIQRAIGLESDVIPSTNGIDLHRYRSQTVADSAYDIMTEKGGAARVTDVLKILTEAGKLKSYQSGYSTVKKTLDRDKRFEKRKPGLYAIVPPTDWLEKPIHRNVEEPGETG